MKLPDEFIEISLDAILAVDQDKPPKKKLLDYLPSRLRDWIRAKMQWTPYEIWCVCLGLQKASEDVIEAAKPFLSEERPIVMPEDDDPNRWN